MYIWTLGVTVKTRWTDDCWVQKLFDIIVHLAEGEVSNEICLRGLIGRGTKWTCQIEAHLEIKSNEQDVSKLPDPTNLQVYSKLSALICFCRQSCDLSLGNRGGRKQSLPDNQHGWFPIISSLVGAEAGLYGAGWLSERQYESLPWITPPADSRDCRMNCVLNQGQAVCIKPSF